MKTFLSLWKNNFIKVLSGSFAFIGAVFVFFPLSQVTSSNIKSRICILIIFLLVLIVISFVLSLWDALLREKKKVYSKGKSKFFFEYSDMNYISKKAVKEDKPITVVVPINTELSIFSDKRIIRKGTVHHWALEYIEKVNNSLVLDLEYIKSLKCKKDGFKSDGKKGDWFLLSADELCQGSKVQFLFLEVYDVVQKNGKWNNSDITKENFLRILQSLFSAIPDILEHEDKIYIPLIGAGAGDVGKSNDIMQLMEALLRFNKSELRQEIHIVLNKKYKKETPIYQLSSF